MSDAPFLYISYRILHCTFIYLVFHHKILHLYSLLSSTIRNENCNDEKYILFLHCKCGTHKRFRYECRFRYNFSRLFFFLITSNFSLLFLIAFVLSCINKTESRRKYGTSVIKAFLFYPLQPVMIVLCTLHTTSTAFLTEFRNFFFLYGLRIFIPIIFPIKC